MGLESATFVSDLNPLWPLGSDLKSAGDDHIRKIKTVLQNTFPSINGAVSATDEELNYSIGLTSATQTQLNGKQGLNTALTAIAGVTPAANKIPYFISGVSADILSITSFTKTILDDATADDVRATMGEGTWPGQQIPSNGTLTDAATIAWDCDSNGQSVKVTLGGNRTMGAPSNVTEFAAYVLRVVQSSGGSNTLTWNSAYKFPDGDDPVITTTANAVDLFTFIGGGSGEMYCVGIAQDVK